MDVPSAPPPGLDVIRWMYEFHSWSLPRVFNAGALLTPEQLRQAGVIAGGTGDGSLFQTMAHVVGAQTLWLSRWKGRTQGPLPGAANYADLESLATSWAAVDREIGEYLGTLDPADLARPVSYMSVAREVMETFPRWQTLIHLANHTAHHRAEACVALTALGSPPQSVDLVDFMRST